MRALGAAALVAACLDIPPAARAAAPPIEITSPAFGHRQEIPSVYTCDGAGISPEIEWTNVPAGTKSLALLVTDPDAPDPAAAHRITWVHWVLYDIPPSASKLPANVPPSRLPAGTRQGLNGWNKTGYGGPCPPSGRHRYFFRLFALDTVLPDLRDPDRGRLEHAMTGHVIGTGAVVGTYARH